MKRKLLDYLGQAAYIARRACLATGTYPKIAFMVPNSTQYYEWDNLETVLTPDTALAVKTVYWKETEATVHAFFAYVHQHGSPAAKVALETLLTEMKDAMLTDVEQAKLASDQH